MLKALADYGRLLRAGTALARHDVILPGEYHDRLPFPAKLAGKTLRIFGGGATGRGGPSGGVGDDEVGALLDRVHGALPGCNALALCGTQRIGARELYAQTCAAVAAQRLSGEASATRFDVPYSGKSTRTVTGGLCATAASTSSGYAWRIQAADAPEYEPPTATAPTCPSRVARTCSRSIAPSAKFCSTDR